jgi:uncharacterized protein
MGLGLELRDPIHGFIYREPLEHRIIDTAVFQRLRRLRQLALASLVYPGAVHTRFDHSIGALHLARAICAKLLPNEDSRRLVRLAALLHDVGHGPFSHVSEPLLQRYSDKSKLKVKNQDEVHELISWGIIQNNSELARLLSEEDREHIVGLLSGSYGYSLYKDIVSGPIDVDKQDYLLRDSHFCGVKYGLYDQGRLTDTLVAHADADDQILALTQDGIHPLEQFVLARYYMHTQVYRHKIRLITDQMISRAISLGIEEDKIGWLRDLYSFDGSPEFLENYLDWYDERLFVEILRKDTPDGYAKKLFGQLHDRKLLKVIFEAPEKDFSDPEVRRNLFGDSEQSFAPLEDRIARTYNLDRNLVIAQKLSFKSATRTESDIGILHPAGLRLFRDASALFSSVNQSIQEQYFHVYAPVSYKDERDKRKRATEFYSDIVKMINELFGPGTQSSLVAGGAK